MIARYFISTVFAWCQYRDLQAVNNLAMNLLTQNMSNLKKATLANAVTSGDIIRQRNMWLMQT